MYKSQIHILDIYTGLGFRNDSYLNKIKSITFNSSINISSNCVDSWDVSSSRDGSVMAYIVLNPGDSSKYDLYIESERGDVYANNDASNMFSGMTSLETINNIDKLNITKTSNLTMLFKDCSSLTSLDLNEWNTNNIENFTSLFEGCSSLEILNIDGWFTSKVKYMDSMFKNCSSLIEIDLSSYNISNVLSMSEMFYSCSNLETIYSESNWTYYNPIANNIFYNCVNLVGGCGSHPLGMNFIHAKVDGSGIFNEGVFTSKNRQICIPNHFRFQYMDIYNPRDDELIANVDSSRIFLNDDIEYLDYDNDYFILYDFQNLDLINYFPNDEAISNIDDFLYNISNFSEWFDIIPELEELIHDNYRDIAQEDLFIYSAFYFDTNAYYLNEDNYARIFFNTHGYFDNSLFVIKYWDNNFSILPENLIGFTPDDNISIMLNEPCIFFFLTFDDSS